jgi:argonaute-like protein implicated in RNA metabolism and viral defense
LKNENTDDGSKISFIEEKFINNFTKIFKQKFTEQIYQEKIPVTILKNLISPALMIELPEKVLSSDKTYNNKIIDALTQVIIESLSTKEDKK